MPHEAAAKPGRHDDEVTIGVGAPGEIEQHALGALEEHRLTGGLVAGGAPDRPRRPWVASRCGHRLELGHGVVEIDRFGLEEDLELAVVLLHEGDGALAERRRVVGEDVAAQGPPLGAILVGGADAAAGGADLAGAARPLAGAVEGAVGRQDQGRPRRQDDPTVDVDALVDRACPSPPPDRSDRSPSPNPR